MNFIAYRRDSSEIADGWRTTCLHVGAIGNKLNDIDTLMKEVFDGGYEVTSGRFGDDDKDNPDGPNTEYHWKGLVSGDECEVLVEHVGCPVPFSMAEIHHATVKVPKDSVDGITPVIEDKFKEYAAEMTARIKKTEENLNVAADE